LIEAEPSSPRSQNPAVVSCAVPVILDVVPGGTEPELQLRLGVWQAVHTCNNPHVNCTGVYWAQTVNNADTNELYWVQFLGSWIHSFTWKLIVQLHTKLLVTVRDTSADCNWSTKRLLLHSIPHMCSRDKQREHMQTERNRRLYIPPIRGLLTEKK